ncbi:protein kinase domain-containing protein [Janibacter sp. G349]|uniref:serine/threonine-protein kinase n=1 Tax=unclassified Janibacter TaxID=2649294 RepID=UPI0020CCF8AD|nr:serine/threonine protein kinase [Janibacter sp. CX7]UTT66118.1 protein kinase [Janibacter sp. CX7]
MSSALPPDLPGLDYVQPLGSGGYADVFLYEQQMPRMKVAVKVLKTEGLTQAIKQQFIDEANTMAQLADHPYIVQVFRSDTSDDGRPYLIMKYYPPPNLAQRARAARFSVEEVLRTGIQLSSAVETAHRAGVIHRDIKPANVLVSQYGSPGLTDFGIAGRGGALEELDDDIGVSIPWAPPEVLFGQSNGDARADVYSLAATLWQLLVGRSPFEVPGGDNSAYALMPRIRSNPPPTTGRADVPQSLERLLAQAMSKNPLARPASAIEFARSLQAIEQDERFSRTAIVVLDELGHSADSGPTPGDSPDRTQLRANSGSEPRPVPGMPPPPLGQPVIGGQLSGGRSIGATGAVPIAQGVSRRTDGPPPPVTSGAPPSQRRPGPSGGVTGAPSGQPAAPGSGPPTSSGPIPHASGPRPVTSSGPRPAPDAGRRRMLPIAAGVAALLVVVGIVAGVIALNGRGGGEASSSSSSSASGGAAFGGSVPTFEMKQEGSKAVITMKVDGFQDGDSYFVRAGPGDADLSRITASGVGNITDGTGTFSQEFGTSDRVCSQVQARRGTDASPWTEIKCLDKS